jgi:uncharacterized protein involved in exopolysaccharide biosynthesis
MVSLYPACWRERYGTEFEAFLEDVKPGWRDGLNLAQGAFAMRITTWNFGKIAAIFGLTGTLLAGVIAFMIPNEYVSMSVIQVQSQRAAAEPDEVATIDRLVRTVLSRKSLADIISKEHLYEGDRAKSPLESLIDRMRKDISVGKVVHPRNLNSSAFTVSFVSPDAVQAQRITRDLTALLIEENSHTASSMPGVLTLGVLDPASVPDGPIYPNRLNIVVLGLVAGVLVAGAVAMIRRPRPQTI